MNAHRANAGLPELECSFDTTDASRERVTMPDSDDLSTTTLTTYRGKLDGGDTTYAGENIAYNHRENFGDRRAAPRT